MIQLLRSIGLGLVLLLPALASCPRPMPQLPDNPLAPGEPRARDAREFREQLKTHLSQGGSNAPGSAQTKGRFIAAMSHGGGTEGVTFDAQSPSCGERGCFTEVQYVDQAAVERFERKMLSANSPFIQWGWGAGHTVPLPSGNGQGALWYFNTPEKW
jgi:hypothetical protein